MNARIVHNTYHGCVPMWQLDNAAGGKRAVVDRLVIFQSQTLAQHDIRWSTTTIKSAFPYLKLQIKFTLVSNARGLQSQQIRMTLQDIETTSLW